MIGCIGDNSAVDDGLDVFNLPSRFVRAYEYVLKRREAMEECGRRGRSVLYRHKDSGRKEKRWHPYTCGSIFCPVCVRRRFWRDFKRYEWFFELFEEISFITLTIPNKVVRSIEDVERSYEEASGYLERLYQFGVFGRRAWSRIERLFEDEVRLYAERVGEGGEWKVDRQRFYFRQFREENKDRLGRFMRFGEVFHGLWRFESTIKRRGGVVEVHPHWHGILVGYVPKLLVTAIWREITGCDEVVVDVRRVGDKDELVSYLQKYLAKEVEEMVKVSRDVELEMVGLWLETVLRKRRLFRAWGIKPVDVEEDDGWEMEESFWSVEGELKTRRNLLGLRKFVRKMRREKKDRELFDYVVFRDIGKEYPLYVELRGDRVYFILDIPDEDLNLFRKHHYLGSNLGSKKDVGEESWDSEWWWWEMQAEKEREGRT